jgi:hypothetical protein
MSAHPLESDNQIQLGASAVPIITAIESLESQAWRDAVDACSVLDGCYDTTEYRFKHSSIGLAHKHCRICGDIIYAVDSDERLIFGDDVIVEDGWLWHERCLAERCRRDFR